MHISVDDVTHIAKSEISKKNYRMHVHDMFIIYAQYFLCFFNIYRNIDYTSILPHSTKIKHLNVSILKYYIRGKSITQHIEIQSASF